MSSEKNPSEQGSGLYIGGLLSPSRQRIAPVLNIEQPFYPTEVRHRSHRRLGLFAREGIDPIARIHAECDDILKPYLVTDYLREQASNRPDIGFELYDLVSSADGGAMLRLLSFLADKQPGKLPIYMVSGVGISLLNPGFATIIDNRLPQNQHSGSEKPFEHMWLRDRSLHGRLFHAIENPYLLDTEFDSMTGWKRYNHEL